MSFGIKQELTFNAQALQLRAQRHEIISGNIANADTPNYKAKDFDFAAALKEATGGDQRVRGVQLSTTNARHIPGGTLQTGPAELLYRVPMQASIDGNTVDPDLERAQFAENSHKYDATLRMINGQLRTLQQAMQNN